MILTLHGGNVNVYYRYCVSMYFQNFPKNKKVHKT